MTSKTPDTPRGITVRWPEGDTVDFIPPDRTCFMVWRDQFGTVHAAGFGDEVDSDTPAFDRAVEAVIEAFDLTGDRP
jgi:hypothetical protein